MVTTKPESPDQISARAGYYTVGEHNCIEVTHCTQDGCLEGES